MTVIKIRVPNCVEKHLVGEFFSKEGALYADLTILREASYSDEIPIYKANEISDMVFHSYSTKFDLNELGIY